MLKRILRPKFNGSLARNYFFDKRALKEDMSQTFAELVKGKVKSEEKGLSKPQVSLVNEQDFNSIMEVLTKISLGFDKPWCRRNLQVMKMSIT